MFAYGIIIYVRSVVLSGCFFAAAEHIGVKRHAVRAKTSRPERHGAFSLIAYCRAAEDISGVERPALRCLAISLIMCYNEAKRRRGRSASRGGAICIVIIAGSR